MKSAHTNPAAPVRASTRGQGRPARSWWRGTVAALLCRPMALCTTALTLSALRYRWPVWTALDGVLHYAVGGVFGPELRGFGLSQLRASFGAGITTVAHSDQSFEALLAFGTETFEAGGAVESTRLTVGTSVNF